MLSVVLGSGAGVASFDTLTLFRNLVLTVLLPLLGGAALQAIIPGGRPTAAEQLHDCPLHAQTNVATGGRQGACLLRSTPTGHAARRQVARAHSPQAGCCQASARQEGVERSGREQ